MILKRTIIVTFCLVFYSCKTDSSKNINKFDPYMNIFKVENNF